MPSLGKIRGADVQFANSGLVTSTGDDLEILNERKSQRENYNIEGTR